MALISGHRWIDQTAIFDQKVAFLLRQIGVIKFTDFWSKKHQILIKKALFTSKNRQHFDQNSSQNRPQFDQIDCNESAIHFLNQILLENLTRIDRFKNTNFIDQKMSKIIIKIKYYVNAW